MQKFSAIIMLSCLCLAACDAPPEARDDASSNVAVQAVKAEGQLAPWLGRWNGPEGTYLEINGDSGYYTVTIADLDGPRTFPIDGIEGGVTFTRDGKVYTLMPGNGEDTGMKWLAGKKDCLIVQTGEGFCRD